MVVTQKKMDRLLMSIWAKFLRCDKTFSAERSKKNSTKICVKKLNVWSKYQGKTRSINIKSGSNQLKIN